MGFQFWRAPLSNSHLIRKQRHGFTSQKKSKPLRAPMWEFTNAWCKNSSGQTPQRLNMAQRHWLPLITITRTIKDTRFNSFKSKFGSGSNFVELVLANYNCQWNSWFFLRLLVVILFFLSYFNVTQENNFDNSKSHLQAPDVTGSNVRSDFSHQQQALLQKWFLVKG